LNSAIKNLNNLETIYPALKNLGQQHLQWGVKKEHYNSMCKAIIVTVAVLLQNKFTAQVR